MPDTQTQPKDAGVPPGAAEADSKGVPDSGRQESETAPLRPKPDQKS